MANTKISQLTEQTSVGASDIIPIVDMSGTPTTKKITRSNFLTDATINTPIINVGSDSTGDMYYRNSDGEFVRLPIGSTGQILSISSNIPTWSASQSNVWNDATSETWTRTSNNTFTVPGDQTAKYAKGTKIKYTQTTQKYGTVASSSYSNPTTTVTLISNTDYVLAAATITDNYYSYITPPGFPSKFNYSCTTTANGGGSYVFCYSGGRNSSGKSRPSKSISFS